MRLEKWEHLPGFENQYLVSSHGRILSFKRNIPSLLIPSKDRLGYIGVKIKGTRKLVHTLVAKAFIPNPENKPEVNHKNSVKIDNNIENLEWVTHKENMDHAYNHTFDKKCGKVWGSKLSLNDAKFIREKFKNPYSAIQLKDMFKVDLTTIYDVMRKDTWNKRLS